MFRETENDHRTVPCSAFRSVKKCGFPISRIPATLRHPQSRVPCDVLSVTSSSLLFSASDKRFNMTSILVSGGAGFLGSHLCDRLIERGDDVLCVDNFFTGRKENVAHLLNHPRFELIRHDIVHPIFLEVEQIYNLACPASPRAYQFNPIKTIKTSTVGMVNILGLAKRCRARVLHASTSEVYGDPEIHPQTEDYWGHVNPIGPRSCYDEGKRVAESLCMNYHLEHGMEVRLIRIFNTYGPRMDPNDGRVISNFIMQALRGEPLTIYGDGSQTRSFCYVDDLLRGMMNLMDHDDNVGPVNVGNPTENTMLELAQQVIEATDSSSKLAYVELPADDPKRRCPNITKAKEVLGWTPEIALVDGLKETVAYYRSQLSREEA
jgi:UDP-glucuronate decarboxylase